MSFPRYPKYKHTGVEWLGEVPEGWDTTVLRRVGYEREESNEGLIEDNLLSLSYGNVIRKDIETREGLLPESFETYQIVHPGDIIFRLTDLQNDKRSLRTALVCECGIITFAYVAFCPEEIESAFLAYLLRDYDCRKIFYSMGGGVRQSMKYEDIRQLRILAPPMEEQRAITGFLDRETAKIDRLIEEQRRLIELLKEKRQAAIAVALTTSCQAECTERSRDGNDNGERTISPRFVRLKHLAKVISKGTTPTTVGGDFADDGVRFLKAENITPAAVSSSPSFFISYETHELLRRSSLERNDVLVVIAGATTGKSAVMPESLLPANTNQAVSFVRLRDPRYAEYVAFWLSMQSVQDSILLTSVQSAQPNLSMEDLGNISIRAVPLDRLPALLDSVRAAVTQCDDLLRTAISAIELLQERRSALISAAVTGQIDVRDYAPQEWPADAEEMYEPA